MNDTVRQPVTRKFLLVDAQQSDTTIFYGAKLLTVVTMRLGKKCE